MSKKLSATFKIFFNSRLKEIDFYKTKTHPAYVQVVYLGKAIYFKASSFVHFLNPSKVIRVAGIKKAPRLRDVINREQEILEFIISNKLGENFTWEKFQSFYAHYSKELTDLTQDGFIDYVYTFFCDQGQHGLAKSLELGMRFTNPWDVMQDLKQSLNKSMYSLLIENHIQMSSPYLALAGYAALNIKWPKAFTPMNLEDPKIKKDFKAYVKKTFPKHYNTILEQVDFLIKEPFV